ncbi:unnamed protein product [Clonostachys rosea]|uniref:Uncharacterized protein n=1 Tax=Bionectria ochroleuca TaxID=29856 RepID=A0ABY6TMR7_BIOOC|nr:unnamed protein product [Clonostachys rosea]
MYPQESRPSSGYYAHKAELRLGSLRVYPPGCDHTSSRSDTEIDVYPFDFVSREKAVSLEEHLDEQFDSSFTPALYESRILDDVSAPHVGRRWWLRNDRYGAARLWQRYLVYRVLGEKDPKVGRYADIRKAAETLCDLIIKSGNDSPSFHDITEGLCWLALERGTNRPGEKRLWFKVLDLTTRLNATTVEELPDEPFDLSSNPELNLLCAAAYFNQVSVAADILQQNETTCSLTDTRDLFPSPLWIAAFRGHRDGAMIYGDVPFFYNVLFPPSIRPDPPPLSQALIDTDSQYARHMVFDQYLCSTPAIYDFITENFPNLFESDKAMQTRRCNHQATYARHGNLTMLRHLVGTSSKVKPGDNGRHSDPLYQACRSCFEDVLDFLLSREIYVKDEAEVLSVAAKAGSSVIMKKLLEYGKPFDPDELPGAVLTDIIRAENTTMLNLILEKGYTVTEEKRDEAMTVALTRGLTSMVKILEDIRLDI